MHNYTLKSFNIVLLFVLIYGFRLLQDYIKILFKLFRRIQHRWTNSYQQMVILSDKVHFNQLIYLSYIFLLFLALSVYLGENHNSYKKSYNNQFSLARQYHHSHFTLICLFFFLNFTLLILRYNILNSL